MKISRYFVDVANMCHHVSFSASAEAENPKLEAAVAELFPGISIGALKTLIKTCGTVVRFHNDTTAVMALSLAIGLRIIEDRDAHFMSSFFSDLRDISAEETLATADEDEEDYW